MNIDKTARVFITAILVCVCAFASGEARADVLELPAGRVIVADYLDRARSLLKEGKAEEAWQMLRNLLREEPDNVEVNVLLSQAAFATGRDNQALTAMERLSDLYPDNAALRLALAKAYARAGDEASSAFEMAEALRLNPDIANEEQQEDLEKAAKLSARRFDRLMAAGRLSMGFIWDSNATGGLDSLDVELGDYTFRLHEDAEKKSAFGEYVKGNLNWSWRLGDSSPWYLAGDFALYGKTYNRDLPSNQNFTWGRAALGIRHVGAKHMFDLRLKADNVTYDPFESATSAGAEASFVYQLLPDFQLIGRLTGESRNYLEYDGKNGFYWTGGIYGRYQFGEGRHAILAGIKSINADTDEDRFSYNGFEAMLRMDLGLTRKLQFTPFFGWRHSQFHDASTRLTRHYGEDDRMDDMLITGCGFTYAWTEHIATEIGWQYIKNNSTSPFYRYDQHQISTGIVFSF